MTLTGLKREMTEVSLNQPTRRYRIDSDGIGFNGYSGIMRYKFRGPGGNLIEKPYSNALGISMWEESSNDPKPLLGVMMLPMLDIQDGETRFTDKTSELHEFREEGMIVTADTSMIRGSGTQKGDKNVIVRNGYCWDVNNQKGEEFRAFGSLIEYVSRTTGVQGQQITNLNDHLGNGVRDANRIFEDNGFEIRRVDILTPSDPAKVTQI